MDKSVYSIWLSMTGGFNNILYALLFSEFKTAEEIYNCEDFDDKYEKHLEKLNDKSLVKAFEVYEICLSKKIGILPYENPLYPSRLRKISAPPPALFYKGNLKSFDNVCTIAVVGTRRMTDYGKNSAYRFAYSFAKSQAVVVSGMAAGVDGMAHRGALDGGGYTVAVLGTPPDRIYPIENAELYYEIMEKGLILSEYYPNSPTAKYSFPLRNRIISGISDATMVIEAGEDSGALITAELAAKQGRRVFALPGDVSNEGSLGTNRLLKKGASMATDPTDVLFEMELLYPEGLNIQHQTEIVQPKLSKKVILPDVLDKTEKAVYDMICQKQPVSPDTIGKELKLDAGDVMSAVSVLEIYKLVKPQAGGLYGIE